MNLQTHKSDTAQFAQFQPEAEIYTEKKKKRLHIYCYLYA